MKIQYHHRHRWASIHQTSSVRVLSQYKSNDKRYLSKFCISHINNPASHSFIRELANYHHNDLHRSKDNYYRNQIYDISLRHSTRTEENDGSFLPAEVMIAARERYGIIKELSRFPVNTNGFDPVESKTLY